MKDKNTYRKFRNMPRSRFELWLDLHNHKLELVRTLASMFALIINAVVLLKVFGKI